MIKAFASFEEKLKQKLPSQTILLVPGACFFCHKLDLPEGIAEPDIDQFAEFSLEGMSPFPIEQLAWGFFHRPKSSHILIYAAYKDRLRREGFDDLEIHQHVFPSFITAVREKPYPEPTVDFLVEGKSLSAVYYQANNPVPGHIHTEFVETDEAGNGGAKEARSAMLKRLDLKGYNIKDGWLVAGETPVLDTKGILRTTLNRVDQSGSHEGETKLVALPLSESALWAADIRDTAYIQRKRKEEATTGKVWMATIAAGVAAVLLIIAQLALWGTHMWIQNRQSLIAEQSASVQEIEGNHGLLNTIQQFAQQELKPFEMLEMLNVERPKEVYFELVEVDSFNEMFIKGVGENADVVYQYTEKLKASPRVKSAVDKVRLDRGKGLFEITVTFAEDKFPPEEVVATSGSQN